jgi:hypothetical protein
LADIWRNGRDDESVPKLLTAADPGLSVSGE